MMQSLFLFRCTSEKEWMHLPSAFPVCVPVYCVSHFCVWAKVIFVFALRWPWVHIKILDVRCRVTWSVQTPRLRWSLFFLGLILSPDPGSWVQLDLGGKPGWKYAISSKLILRSCFSTHNTTKLTMTLQSSDWSSKGRSKKCFFQDFFGKKW